MEPSVSCFKMYVARLLALFPHLHLLLRLLSMNNDIWSSLWFIIIPRNSHHLLCKVVYCKLDFKF